ncbi:TetR/AcrR family transcriptional regulator [Streptomyces sp. XY332]|uniref:TetR/AcrR family transcriptional regulator n=2 Tax=unclassified Streptomyces TaxID=2593676 RepID=UPI0006B1C034|nr:TetR/AcrR family transcriptional regulator [Streptomyces sp. XY332]KOY50158.1 TetR family transcriptional regulator [Streptomyces sp. XY332]
MAGRPRGIDDATILRAAVDVMGRTGPAKLTLALLAREVGLVPGTLVQRFGSKRGLLLALAEHTAKDACALYEGVRAEHDSPLAALAALVVETWAAATSPEAFANHLAFLCADLDDTQFRDCALVSQQAQSHWIGELLDHAKDARELGPDTDTTALAATVQAATLGVAVLWAVDRQGALAERQRAALDAVLAPHRPAQ